MTPRSMPDADHTSTAREPSNWMRSLWTGRRSTPAPSRPSVIGNPIRLARRLLENGEHMMLVGDGARQFALEQGFEPCDPAALVIDRERDLWTQWRDRPDAALLDFATDAAMGTVSAVAFDTHGHLAAGTSTGGTLCKHPGRVGDSSLIGCGCYADHAAGAVSCTGLGEAIMRVVLAKTAIEHLRDGRSPADTARLCVQLLQERGRGAGGLIALNTDGTPGVAFTTSRMAYGYVAPDGSVVLSPDA